MSTSRHGSPFYEIILAGGLLGLLLVGALKHSAFLDGMPKRIIRMTCNHVRPSNSIRYPRYIFYKSLGGFVIAVSLLPFRFFQALPKPS